MHPADKKGWRMSGSYVWLDDDPMMRHKRLSYTSRAVWNLSIKLKEKEKKETDERKRELFSIVAFFILW